jgi:hypothetical protein
VSWLVLSYSSGVRGRRVEI